MVLAQGRPASFPPREPLAARGASPSWRTDRHCSPQPLGKEARSVCTALTSHSLHALHSFTVPQALHSRFQTPPQLQTQPQSQLLFHLVAKQVRLEARLLKVKPWRTRSDSLCFSQPRDSGHAAVKSTRLLRVDLRVLSLELAIHHLPQQSLGVLSLELAIGCKQIAQQSFCG